MPKSILTVERLRELLHYDPNTGLFTRRIQRHRHLAGVIAGHLGYKGYVQMNLMGMPYKAHRLAWLYVYSEWPKDQIDHINGVRNDNRINNLRDVSKSVNRQNQHILPTNNTSGFVGVTWHKGYKRFRARIGLDNKRKHLGSFDTAEAASEAYRAAKMIFHKEGLSRGDDPIIPSKGLST